MPDRVAVTSAEFIRSIGYWQGEALRRPISITHHGRERLVLATPDQFQPPPGGEGGEETAASLSRLRAESASVLEHIEEGFLAFDGALKVCAANAAAEAFSGLARAELVGRGVLAVLPQPVCSVTADRLQRVLRSHQSEQFEVGSFDGRQLLVRVFPYGPAVALLFANRTEQRNLINRIEDCIALESALKAHSRAAAIKLDARSRVESVDDVFCGWSGFSREEVVGHRFIDLVSAPERRCAAGMLEQVLGEGETLEIALTLLGKTSTQIPCAFSAAPIFSEYVAKGIFAVCFRDGESRAGDEAVRAVGV